MGFSCEEFEGGVKDANSSNKSGPSPERGSKKITGEAHYARLDPEPITVIESWGLNFRLGNALKYLSRAGHKPGASKESDLRKALWYINRELEHAGSTTPTA